MCLGLALVVAICSVLSVLTSVKTTTGSLTLFSSAAGAVDEHGMYTDTEDIDCLICKCDMWLYAVVAPSCPGKAACTEHARQLGCPRSEQVLLYR